VTPQSAELLESFRNIDENYYRIYTLGLWGGVLEGLIYDNWEIAPIASGISPDRGKLLGYGLDWGFTNDPTAIIRVNIGDDVIYLDEVLYKKGVTNQDIIKELTSAGINKTDEIVADSAEPKSIHELYAAGWNIHPAVKGPDSVRAGIDKIRQYRVVVTERSVNLIRELKNYRWKMDKDGNSLNEPIDAFNHGLDAVRYVLLNKLTYNRKRIQKVRSMSL
jgi:phage terminase large subunit